LRQLGVLSEGAIRSDGRLRTTPGFAMVAATIAGSRVSFANPCLKTLVLEPQASAAAFIDGAATARSKNPEEVWEALSLLAIDLAPCAAHLGAPWLSSAQGYFQ